MRVVCPRPWPDPVNSYKRLCDCDAGERDRLVAIAVPLFYAGDDRALHRPVVTEAQLLENGSEMLSSFVGDKVCATGPLLETTSRWCRRR